MRLVSVNVGRAQEVGHRGRTVSTGIFKAPVEGRVAVRTLGVEGDEQGDPRVHGGTYQAVYVYPVEHYAAWRAELGREDFGFGQFGENFTVEGMREDSIHVGDVFRIGTAMMEVTQPRQPCFKLGLRMGRQGFPRLFLRSGRVGFYFRVLIEGEVGAGDPIERVREDPFRMSVERIHLLRNFETRNVEGARKAMSIPALSPGWRACFRERVEEADQNPRGTPGCCDLPV